ncbi:proline-rich protein 5-like isoform X1 [Branchiostoma floridae]|uniref:Proline-rich protein 5-like isoform X1 n=2 Tax=Branchiostoma floridae TaxID=7739 RepID=A0A9J7MTS6_BRAFL|nr:proline-rich protein 5-like isoform X1 [Branchiostoma floridae]
MNLTHQAIPGIGELIASRQSLPRRSSHRPPPVRSPTKNPVQSGRPRGFAQPEWYSVQSAVVSLFQHKKLPPNELDLLNEKIRMLMKTEVGPFILDYFQNQLLKKGMVILREKIKREKGQQLLECLSDIWDYFFCEVLPMLQAIFCPVQATGFSVREMSLVGFRDTILLKIAFSDALDTPDVVISPSITQMLLVLQSVHDNNPEYLQLESLVARIVSPYLGLRGLYMGGPEPLIPANKPVTVVLRQKTLGDEPLKGERPLSMQLFPAQQLDEQLPSPGRGEAHKRAPSAVGQGLDPLVEGEVMTRGYGRRHSIAGGAGDSPKSQANVTQVAGSD